MRIHVVLFGLASFSLGLSAIVASARVRLPGDDSGYQPEQPLAYSHRLHGGGLGIDCLYCHYGARTSRHAGIPPAQICLNCHTQVTAGYDAILEERQMAEAESRDPQRIISSELAKLYDALGLGEDLRPDPQREARPVEWVKVHSLPDYVWFDHSVHVARGMACESCHGPVETMERVRQEASLSMGWCVDCHRQNSKDRSAPPLQAGRERAIDHVSTDCATCHF